MVKGLLEAFEWSHYISEDKSFKTKYPTICRTEYWSDIWICIKIIYSIMLLNTLAKFYVYLFISMAIILL